MTSTARRLGEVIDLSTLPSDDDEDDDVVIVLSSRPSPRTKVGGGGGRKKQASGAGESEAEEDEGELEVVGVKGPRFAVPSIHARHDCGTHRFPGLDHWTGVPKDREAAARCCQSCYCFVCEVPAGQCIEWALHSAAVIGGPMQAMWRRMRAWKRAKHQHQEEGGEEDEVMTVDDASDYDCENACWWMDDEEEEEGEEEDGPSGGSDSESEEEEGENEGELLSSSDSSPDFSESEDEDESEEESESEEDEEEDKAAAAASKRKRPPSSKSQKRGNHR